jgi:Aspartyl protease
MWLIHNGSRAAVLATALVAHWASLPSAAGMQSPGVPPSAPVCTVRADDRLAPAPLAPGRADWLLRQQRYPELAQWVATQQRGPTASGVDLTFFRGMLANKQNQNTASIRLLEPLLSRRDLLTDSARGRAILKTLADDYTKTYRYRDAADALARLDRAYGKPMSAVDRKDLRNDIMIRTLLREVRPQDALVPRAFAVPIRRNEINVPETVVHVGADSSSWLLDTGANISTIAESMARRLGLRLMPGIVATKGITGASVPTHVAVIPELQVGAAWVRNVVVLVFPDSALYIPQVPFQIHAVLGYPVLEAFDRITIGTDSLGVYPHPAGVPSDSSNLFLDELQPLVAVTIDDSTRLLHFDSGADRTSFGARFCRAYPARMKGLKPRSIQIGGAGGARTYQVYELDQLPINIGGTTTTLDSVQVFQKDPSASFDQFYGNLAGDVAARFGGYTIDFRDMTFRLGSVPLQAVKAPAAPYQPDGTASPTPVTSAPPIRGAWPRFL